MLRLINPYAQYESLEEKRWEDFYHQQNDNELHNERAAQFESLFPIELSDFNPNNSHYSQYLQSDIAQELYANFVMDLSEYLARKMR